MPRSAIGTVMRWRKPALTTFSRILQANPTSNIQNSDYPLTSPSFHRCFCAHHSIQNKTNGMLLKPQLSSSYHSKKKLPDEESSGASDSTQVEDEDEDDPPQSTISPTSASIASEGFVAFEDEKQVIQDVQEQEWNPIPPHPFTIPLHALDNVNLERGQTGVFDLEELLSILRDENAQDICVIAVPKEMQYADHMVIVTGRSPKHNFAIANFIRRRFKTKERKPSDIIPKLEGTKKDSEWIALDLGNIALHLFTRQMRDEMDLETLWTVGPLFDDQVNAKDPEIVMLLNLFSTNFNDSPRPSKK